MLPAAHTALSDSLVFCYFQFRLRKIKYLIGLFHLPAIRIQRQTTTALRSGEAKSVICLLRFEQRLPFVTFLAALPGLWLLWVLRKPVAQHAELNAGRGEAEAPC